MDDHQVGRQYGGHQQAHHQHREWQAGHRDRRGRQHQHGAGRDRAEPQSAGGGQADVQPTGQQQVCRDRHGHRETGAQCAEFAGVTGRVGGGRQPGTQAGDCRENAVVPVTPSYRGTQSGVPQRFRRLMLEI